MPPVFDNMVTENSHLDGRPDIATSPWNQHFRIYYLTEKMRSAKDPFFSALSDRVKVGRLVEGDTEYSSQELHPVLQNFRMKVLKVAN